MRNFDVANMKNLNEIKNFFVFATSELYILWTDFDFFWKGVFPFVLKKF